MCVRAVVTLAALLLLLTGCARLDLSRVERSPSFVPPDIGATRLHAWVARDAARHPSQSGFLTRERGLDAFVARAARG
jgi:hypothetical protein